MTYIGSNEFFVQEINQVHWAHVRKCSIGLFHAWNINSDYMNIQLVWSRIDPYLLLYIVATFEKW